MCLLPACVTIMLLDGTFTPPWIERHRRGTSANPARAALPVSPDVAVRNHDFFIRFELFSAVVVSMARWIVPYLAVVLRRVP